MPKSDKHLVAVDRLKVVIRRLPPNIPEEIFWESVKPWVTDESIVWKSFIKGKVGVRNARESVPSRAYVSFRTHDNVAAFARDFEGHLYRDKQGNETRAVVEFAPFQKIPPADPKPDTKYVGSIAKDPDYNVFIEGLQVKKLSEQDTLDAFLQAAAESKQDHTSTPLLEALKMEKAAAQEAALARRHALAQQEKSKKGKGPPPAVSTSAPATSAGEPSTPKKKRNKKDRARAKEKAEEKPPPTPKIIMTKKDKDAPPHAEPIPGASSSSAPKATLAGEKEKEEQPKQVTPKKPHKPPPTPKADSSPTAPPPERKRGGGPSSRGFQMALSGTRGGGRGRGAPPSQTISAGPAAPSGSGPPQMPLSPAGPLGGGVGIGAGADGPSHGPSHGRGRGRGRGRGGPPPP